MAGPASLKSQSPEKGRGPSQELIPPHPPSPEPESVISTPTQHPRAFRGLRGILSFPPSIQPSQTARQFHPEGRGTSG